MGWAICWVDIGYCNTDMALWTDRAMSRVGENFKGRENNAVENRRPRQCGERNSSARVGPPLRWTGSVTLL